MKRKDARADFFAAFDNGEMTLSETVRAMRKSIGMSQTDYARMLGIAPRIIIDLERGVGNPTLGSLQKIAESFGLQVSFRRTRF